MLLFHLLVTICPERAFVKKHHICSSQGAANPFAAPFSRISDCTSQEWSEGDRLMTIPPKTCSNRPFSCIIIKVSRAKTSMNSARAPSPRTRKKGFDGQKHFTQTFIIDTPRQRKDVTPLESEKMDCCNHPLCCDRFRRPLRRCASTGC